MTATPAAWLDATRRLTALVGREEETELLCCVKT